MSQETAIPIVFPENVVSTKNKTAVPPALKYVTSLLYNSGKGLTVLYFILIFIVQPLLQAQYDRRNDLAAFVLEKTRTVLRKITETNKLSPVAIARGEKFYSDAQIQTEDEDFLDKSFRTVSFNDSDADRLSPNLISSKFEKLIDSLNRYQNYHATSVEDLYPLSFQVKKFQNRIDGYHQATLLRARGSNKDEVSFPKIKSNIRHLKGLFLTGQA